MPMMPFMGVRISWLMLARNSLLSPEAATARSRASASSRAASSSLSSARRRSVMSWYCQRWPRYSSPTRIGTKSRDRMRPSSSVSSSPSSSVRARATASCRGRKVSGSTSKGRHSARRSRLSVSTSTWAGTGT